MDNMIFWSPGVTLESIEKQVILRAYDYYKKNKTATANSLDIAIRTLDNKLEKYAKDSEDEQKRLNDERERRKEFLQRAKGIEQRIVSTTTNTGFDGAATASLPSRPTADKSEPKKESGGVHGASAGVRVESAPKAPEKPAVSVPKREEVQSMPPKPASKSGASGASGKVSKTDERA